MATEQPAQFALGVNYWPRRKAMYWWSHCDYREVQEDFLLLARTGLQVIRIFLNWEDFQPRPEHISERALGNLVLTADLAITSGLKLIPTFFCGHMSGVNWLPPWLLAPASANGLYPTFSDGKLIYTAAADFYSDPALLEAQLLQISAVVGALAWCFADYAPGLWDKPPLDQCCHERHFGLVRHDGSPKKNLAVLQAAAAQEPPQGLLNTELFFQGFSRASFYNAPALNLTKMFSQFKLILKEQIR